LKQNVKTPVMENGILYKIATDSTVIKKTAPIGRRIGWFTDVAEVLT
tara:strand:+ start:487 stop:627 length:141 start_codon:yes stop_codon:yes gene_type:complete